MKTLKRIDAWINFALVCFFFVSTLSRLTPIFLGYFVVGGWQVISMLVHTFGGWFLRPWGSRWLFHRVVVILGLCVLLSNWVELMIFIFFVLLLFSPLMAIVYTMICFDENKALKRPIEEIK